MTQPDREESDSAPRPLLLASDVAGARLLPPPLGRAVLAIVISSLMIGVICLGTFAVLPLDQTDFDAKGELARVSILRPELAAVLFWLLPVGLGMLLFAGVVLRARKRLSLRGVVLWPILACMLAAGTGIYRNLGPWRMCGQVTASDGQRYAFLDSSFMQGQTMAIARARSPGLLYVTMDVLGTTNGDSPSSYLLVVRPAPVTPVDYGDLRATTGGLVVGLRHDNECFMVYDIGSQRFYARGDVEGLSPFLLLDETSSLYRPDREALMAEISDPTSTETTHVPDEARLRASLAHPNPAVRQFAAALLDASKDRGRAAGDDSR